MALLLPELIRRVSVLDKAAGDYIKEYISASERAVFRNTKAKFTVDCLFTWMQQPQGHGYWHKLHNTMLDRGWYNPATKINKSNNEMIPLEL